MGSRSRMMRCVLSLVSASLLAAGMLPGAAPSVEAGQAGAARTAAHQPAIDGASVQAAGQPAIDGASVQAAGQPAAVAVPGQSAGPSTVVGAGNGGYVALDPTRIASLTALMPGDVNVTVAGVGGVPSDGVAAVILNLVARNVSASSSITVWPAGTARPAIPNLEVDASRDWSTTVLVAPGQSGAISVNNQAGQVDLDINVVGWFPVGSQLTPVGPTRVLDTKVDPGKKLQPGQVLSVQVTSVADVPAAADVAAVVLRISASSSSGTSRITVWPAGQDQPETADLMTDKSGPRSNLAVVAPGAGGAVSVSSETEKTHLAVDILGWIPAASAYRAVTPTTLPDTGSQLAQGATLDVSVAGVDGIAAVDAYAAVLDVVTPRPANDTSLTLYAKGDYTADNPPDTVTIAAGLQEPTVNLAIVKLGTGGKVSIYNAGPATDVTVEVLGWFALPDLAAQLTVPQSTEAPPAADVMEAQVDTTNANATIELAPGAAPVAPGDHIVLGITPDTPDGYIGTVDSVSTVGGVQHVTTTQATLDEVFPEGDINVNLDHVPLTRGASQPATTALGPGVAAASVPPLSWEYPNDGTGSCDVSGLTVGLSADVGFQFGLHWSGLTPKVTAIMTLDAKAWAKLNKIEAHCSVDNLPEWKVEREFNIGPVPVVLELKFQPSLDIYAGLKGIDLGASMSFDFQFGVRDNGPITPDGKYYSIKTNFSTTTPSFDGLMPKDMSLFAMLDPWANFSVLLYNVVGPTISAGTFYEAFVTTDSSKPLWAVDMGWAGKAGVTVSLELSWFYTWTHTWTFVDAELPIPAALEALGLVSACSTYGPGYGSGYSGPCVTPKPSERADGSTRIMAARLRLVSAGKPLDPLRITTPGPLAFPALPEGIAGQPYQGLKLSWTGWSPDGAYWTLAKGSELPPGTGNGMMIDPATGALVGTPSEAGTYTFTVALWYGPASDPTEPASPDTIKETVRIVQGGTSILYVAPTGSPTNQSGGSCSTPGWNTIEDAAPNAIDGDTIHICAGTYDLTHTVTVAADNVFVVGDGAADTIIDGGGNVQLFSVDAPPLPNIWRPTTFSYLTFQNGYSADHGGAIDANGDVLVGDSTFSGNSATTSGGAISASGSVAVANSTFNGNVARNASSGGGGGAINADKTVTVTNGSFSRNYVVGVIGDGGAISASGSVDVTDSTFHGNKVFAIGDGGAINTNGTVTATNSTFSGNSAINGGGAISSADATVTNSSFSNNSAAVSVGGAIYAHSGAVVTSSTFSNNSATPSGGAGGGAIYAYSGAVVTSSTFSNNSAVWGGAVDSGTGSATVTNSTFSGNSANNGGGAISSADATVTSSILAQASGTNNCNGGITDGGGNFSTDWSCGFTKATSHQGVAIADLALGALADNGGPTQTIALKQGSVAIDDVPCTLAYDQRGEPRPDVDAPAETQCDAGAYESAWPPTTIFVAQSPTASGVADGGSCSAPSYNTIQAAVDHAAAGDTIHVCAGTYDLTATIAVAKNRLTFAGDGAAGTIIDGGHSVQLFDVSVPTVTFSGLTFRNGNSATTGGAINASGSVTVTDSTFDGNSAAIYSGAVNADGTVTVANSTFSDNRAISSGGGGGAIGADSVSVTNSTFSGNTATGVGGAINAGSVTITGSTFSNNTATGVGGAINAGTASVTNTILAQTSGTNNCSGTITDGGGNFSTDASCKFIDPTSHNGVTSGDLALGTLADNGGPTQTIALKQGSVAIDAVSCGALTTDQRGESRPDDPAETRCDAGAFESAYVPVPTTLYVAPAGSPPTGSSAASCTNPDFNTMQAAVDHAAFSAAPDTIHICAGMYDLTAPVTVGVDNLTFAGDGAAGTIIDGGHGVQLFSVAAPTVTFSGLTLRDGSATYGGAINADGSVTVTDSTFDGNSATTSGGAIFTVTVTVANSTFSGNSVTSGYGGALYAYTGNVTATDSTFSDNSAPGGNGGAIYANGTSLTVTNSTFSGNTATGNGAALAAVSGGGSGTATVTNSILAQASGTNNCSGTITDGGGNFSTDASCGFSGDGTTLASLALGTLADNGGPTPTIALGQGSVAIDAVSCTLATDQRGEPRPDDPAETRCDAGAYESAYAPVSTTLYVAPTGSGGGSCASPDSNTIQGAVDQAVAGDTIHICAGTYNLAATVSVATDNLTFEGDGPASTIIDGSNGGTPVQLFSVTAPTVTFSGLTFQNGSGSNGGAIDASSGSVTVTDSTFSGNSATYGGAVNAGGTVTVSNSTFDGNTAAIYSGAINTNGTVDVTNSTFSGNSATDVGGGGGAIGADSVSVTNSTFSNNSAASGGGIEAGGTITITNSTFSGNTATGVGAAFDAISGTVSVTNTILAQASGTNNCYANSGTFGDGGGNFSTDASCSFTDSTSQNSVDPASLALGTLADNGGPTPTIALGQGSVAIDAAACTLTTDQRGEPRPDVESPPETLCDAGAYESAYAPVPTATAALTPRLSASSSPTPSSTPTASSTPSPSPAPSPTSSSTPTPSPAPSPN